MGPLKVVVLVLAAAAACLGSEGSSSSSETHPGLAVDISNDSNDRRPACLKGMACTEIGAKGEAGKEILVFGGEYNRKNVRNETWLLHLGHVGKNPKNPWHLLSKPGQDAPSPRWKASLTTIPPESSSSPSRIFMFGGSSSDEAPRRGAPAGVMYDDLWEFVLDKTTGHWVRVGPKPSAANNTKEWPVARRAHTAVAFVTKMLVFAGRGPQGVLSDFWAYDTKNNAWVSLPEFPGMPRKGHSACMYLGTFAPAGATWADVWGEHKSSPSMIVFGGRHNDIKYTNDVWAFTWDNNKNERGWVQLDEGGPSRDSSGARVRPAKRNHHSAIMRENIMLVFGGRSSHASYAVHDDLWAYDVVRSQWTQVDTINPGQGSPGRMEHCAVLMNNNKLMAIVSGQDGSSNRRNDAWTFNLETGVWNEIVPSQCTVPASRGAIVASVIILVLGALLITYRFYQSSPSRGYQMIR